MENKALGDKLKPTKCWLKERLMFLYRGVSAKFSQNAPLAKKLLMTEDWKLYEATMDLYFGGGIRVNSTKWEDGSWTGKNIAGEILMKVRGNSGVTLITPFRN